MQDLSKLHEITTVMKNEQIFPRMALSVTRGILTNIENVVEKVIQ